MIIIIIIIIIIITIMKMMMMVIMILLMIMSRFTKENTPCSMCFTQIQTLQLNSNAIGIDEQLRIWPGTFHSL